MGVMLEWKNGRGFVNSDHVVQAKAHIDADQIKLYVRDALGNDHLIRDPSDTSKFEYKLPWEDEARRQILALKKVIQGERPEPKPEPETKKTVVRKAK